MFRISAFVTGAAAFGVVHAIEMLAWRTVFEPGAAHAPWFLNSGRAAAFAAACLFIVSMYYSRYYSRRRGRASPAAPAWAADVFGLTAGAVAAMTAVLAVMGPGTIFPIALTIGAAISAAAAAAGALAGTKL